MKILHIHPSMASGGIESMVCSLANEMSKTEDVTVCSIFEPISTDSFWYKISGNVIKKTLGKRTSGFSLRVLWDIYCFIKDGRYDVVNLHGMFYYYILPILFLHQKIRFFYTVHSDARMENTVWDKRFLIVKKICFRKGWLNPITISFASQNSFTKLYNVPSTLIFNGVPCPSIGEENPVQKYRMFSTTKVFIHAGRISVPKNQLVLCRVFQRLIQEGYDIVLLIAGAKQSDEIFASMEPYFSDRIIYLGQRNDVCQLMAYSDAMCLPSIWEGLPVTLLESLSVGCVPICSNVGGIVNVIESGKNGFLSRSSSEQDYYETIKTVLSLPQEEFTQIRKACCESFAAFDIKNVAKLYLDTYNDNK